MKIFKMDAVPGKKAGFVLSMMLFAAMISGYVGSAYHRHSINPRDKIMPIPEKILDGVKETALVPDRNNELVLFTDTYATGKRFAISLAIVFSGVLLGVLMGVFPYIETFFYRFLVFFDKMPALAVLPLIFVMSGIGETTKIVLVVVGVLPTVILDTYLRAKSIPTERIYKSRTLGYSDTETCFRIVLPEIWPDVLDTIRLNFKAIIGLLIAAESIAATSGLGFRIFVAGRNNQMHLIIPYVLWISALLFIADQLVQLKIKSYKWRKP